MTNTNIFLAKQIEEYRERVQRNFETLKERVNDSAYFDTLVEVAAEDYLDSIKMLSAYLQMRAERQANYEEE